MPSLVEFGPGGGAAVIGVLSAPAGGPVMVGGAGAGANRGREAPSRRLRVAGPGGVTHLCVRR